MELFLNGCRTKSTQIDWRIVNISNANVSVLHIREHFRVYVHILNRLLLRDH